MPPDAGAASARKDRPPQDADLSAEALAKADRRDGRGGGFHVTVSRQRLDYGRPLLQVGANSNNPPAWTPARITGLGQFRALALLTTTPCDTTASIKAFRTPVRPAPDAGEPVSMETGSEGADDGLTGLLDAIAAHVMGRAATICAGISADFANRIRNAHRTMPRDQVAGAIIALKQAKKVAVKFVRESAASEVRGLQEQAKVMFRRLHFRLIQKVKGPFNNVPLG